MIERTLRGLHRDRDRAIQSQGDRDALELVELDIHTYTKLKENTLRKVRAQQCTDSLVRLEVPN